MTTLECFDPSMPGGRVHGSGRSHRSSVLRRGRRLASLRLALGALGMALCTQHAHMALADSRGADARGLPDIHRAEALLRAGQYAPAVKSLRRILDREADAITAARAYTLLCTAEVGRGRVEAALSACDKGDELIGHAADRHVCRGQALLLGGSPGGALVEFHRALALAPRSTGATRGVIRAHRRLSDRRLAPSLAAISNERRAEGR